MSDKQLINIGKISGVFGIKGWVKIFSHTSSRIDIVTYSPWLLKKQDKLFSVKVIKGQLQSKNVVAQLENIDDRDKALECVGADIFIQKNQLPALKENEYYWSDLIGLTVQNLEQITLGQITGMMETGSNDVLIVKGERERAIPFLQDVNIKNIDLVARIMIVDWDADF